MNRFLLKICMLAMVLGFGFRASAADIVTVTGEATFYDDGTRSRVECMKLAAEQARVDALARKFGTIVSQDIMQTDRIDGKAERTDFFSLSSTQVKGEWIADDGEPQYEISYDKDQNMIVKCRIRGKAREITNEAVEFDSMVLRNGTDVRNASTEFVDGDDMFLYVKTPTNGFVTVFLEEENGKVFLLLPYPHDTRTRIAVRGNKEYVFFSEANRGDQTGNIQEMRMTAPDVPVYNRMYVVFSEKYYSRPVMDLNADGLLEMPLDEFTKWLVKTRRNDAGMSVKAMNIMVNPRPSQRRF